MNLDLRVNHPHTRPRLWRLAAVLCMAAGLASCEDGGPDGQPLSSASPAAATQAAAASLQGRPAPADAGAHAALTPEQSEREAQVKQHYTRLGAGLIRLEWPADGGPVVIRARLGHPPALEHELFYHAVLSATAGVFRNQPFRLIDEEQGTLIEAAGQGDTVMQHAVINGTPDFFQAESLKHPQLVTPIPAPEPGPLLRKLIRSGWSDSAVKSALGKPDSEYDGSNVFWRQRVWVGGRERASRLLFRPDYAEPVAGAIGTRSSRADIVSALGPPPFESGEDQVFGYKLEPYYLFFSGKEAPYEIAVYPRLSGAGRKPALTELVQELTRQNRMNADDFVEQLRERWTDYDYYYYGRGSHQIAYYAAGVSIPYVDSSEPPPFLVLYGNYEGPVTDGLSLPEDAPRLSASVPDRSVFRFRLHEDLMFEQEKRRVRQNRAILARAEAEGVPSPDGTQVAMPNEGYVFEQAGFFLLRPGGDRPPVERRTGHFASHYTWLNDRYFLYEVAFRGILAYDTERLNEMPVAGDADYSDDYRLVEVDTGRGVIHYTKGDVKLEKRYSFDKTGNLVFP